jgi:hypothetical protein
VLVQARFVQCQFGRAAVGGRSSRAPAWPSGPSSSLMLHHQQNHTKQFGRDEVRSKKREHKRGRDLLMYPRRGSESYLKAMLI